MALTLWGTTGSFFGAAGPAWFRPQDSTQWNVTGTTWIETGVVTAGTYSVVVVSQDPSGELSAPTTLTTVTGTAPFTGSNAGVFQFTQSGTVASNAAAYWVPGSSAGLYSLVYLPFNVDYHYDRISGTAVTSVGTPKTIITDVIPTTWNFTVNSSGTGFAYTYNTASGTYLQTFDSAGNSTSAPQFFAGSAANVLAADSTNNVFFGQASGSSINVSSVNMSNGVLTPVATVSTDLSSIYQFVARYNADGTFAVALQGVAASGPNAGKNVIELAAFNSSGVLLGTSQLALNTTSTNIRVDARILGDGVGYVVAYSDLTSVGGSTTQTNLLQFNINGGLVSTITGAISGTFDRLRQLNSDNLVELSFRSGSNGTELSRIYDLRAANQTVTGTSANEFLTSTTGTSIVNGLGGNDFVAPGLGTATVDGGGGYDFLEYRAASSNFTVVQNGNGSWTISASYSNGGITNTYSDTVTNVEVVNFTDKKIALRQATAHDSTSSGYSDLIWTNASTGAVVDWNMNGATVTGAGTLTNAQSAYTIIGSGDFGGDGYSDVLWRNNTTGAVAMWQMNGNSVLSNTGIGGDTTYSIVGTGDFDGDGRSDILWRNNTTGAVQEWQMAGASTSKITVLGGDTTYSVVGTGDYNGDGNADILWRNNASGVVVEWNMNGGSVLNTASIGGDTTWSVVASGDFNGDGHSDILWRNGTTGAVVEWLMSGANGTTLLQSTAIGGDTNWSVQAIGDYNNDGKADILWRNTTGVAGAQGTVLEWLMNSSGGIAQQNVIGGGDANWRPLGV